jgi:Ca-activated chloride channel family protein
MLEFHFLRPWWLAILPIGVWLVWQFTRSAGLAGRWRRLVDRDLQPYVLTGAQATVSERRIVVRSALTAWTLATLALAGPAWERQPVRALRSDEAPVVVLDLSRSMDAADIEPSRLARAKLKLLDLLERRESGQTGLVVFSAHAFTVAPLTTDSRNIAALVASLSTDIMPSRGSHAEVGLRKGAELLRQAGATVGEILLMTDAEADTIPEQVAEELSAEGIVLNVLAVGTAEGAPISLPGGGFLTDRAGRVVVPQVDMRGLRRLAVLGGGRFAALTPDDSDLDILLGDGGNSAGDALDVAKDEERYSSELWRDQGLWLVILLLPFIALAFRRGWIVVVGLWLMLPVPRAHALEWADLWLRPDQRGQQAFNADEHARAAELFSDPSWVGAALYRAGDYAASAEQLASLETPDAHYNRGNALARAGEFEAAIQAYERVLELDPEHEDARYNRDLLLEQTPPESEQDAQNGDSGEDESERSAQENQDQPPPTEPQDPQRPENLEPMTPEDAQQSAATQAATETENADEQPPQDFEPLPTPGELEEWASEQAADQWLRRIPQDPGGLLRRKFLFQYQRLGVDQDGNYVWPGDDDRPW